jgi:hypothetical protein
LDEAHQIECDRIEADVHPQRLGLHHRRGTTVEALSR